MPDHVRARGERTYRSITLEDREVEFSTGFTDLHTESYKNILEGKGFSLEDASQAVHIAHEIRHAKKTSVNGEYHPLVKFPLSEHPFVRKKEHEKI